MGFGRGTLRLEVMEALIWSNTWAEDCTYGAKNDKWGHEKMKQPNKKERKRTNEKRWIFIYYTFGTEEVYN